MSSPKSQARDNNRSCMVRSFNCLELQLSALSSNHNIIVINAVNRDDNKDEMFSVGQSLRIRVGPLKGYLCRVLAIRRSDVTVKLDSQHKILTGMMMLYGI